MYRSFDYNQNYYQVLDNDSDTSVQGSITEIVTRNEYQLDKYVNLCGSIIDIGANCGVATIILAKQNPLATIYSYEPHYITFKMLAENVRINELTNVKLFNLAVSDSSNKELTLFLTPKFSGGNTTCSNESAFNDFYHTQNRETVKCISFDDIIKQNKIKVVDLLKIDCEGAEYEIIYNSLEIKKGIVKDIVGEFHNLCYNTQITTNSQDLIEYCKKYITNVNISTLTLEEGSLSRLIAN